MRAPLSAVLAAGLALLAAACTPRPQSLELSGPTMGTTWHVTVVGPRIERRRSEVQGIVDQVLAETGATLSAWDPASELSVLNRNTSTDWVPVSPLMFDALSSAQRVSAATGGAFDVTVAPLVRLWGFGPGSDAGIAFSAPDREFVHDAMASVGFRWLELRASPRAVRRLRMPLEIDVNGVAPGLAVDRIAAALRAAGLHDHLVEIGGEVKTGGHRADGRGWRVAIEAPLAGERRAYAGLELSNLAVSTSGDYRDRRRLRDGRSIGHTLDPRSGEPVAHGLQSVTVVHHSAAAADAYATALLVLGPEEGIALAQRLGLAVLMLEKTATPGTWGERTTAQFEALRRPVE
jgi:thiamine biosynthesis lipoprotein